jgi:predicted MFS family arabinose efflux permease
LVRGSRPLRWTLATATVTYGLWAVAGILEPLYVRDVLEASDTTFALIQTVFGIGMVGTGVLVARLGDRIATPRTVALAVIASGAASAAYFGTKSVALAYLGVFLWGIDVAFFLAPVKTLLQRSTPAEAHGRVLSINTSLEPAAAVVLAPLAGFALGYLSVQTLALTLAVCVTIAGLLALRTSPPIEPAVIATGVTGVTAGTDEGGETAAHLGSPTPLAGPAPG